MFLKKTVRQLLIVLFIALIGLLATTGSVSFAPLGGTGTGPGGVGSTDGLSTLEIWVKGDTGVYSDSGCTTAASNGGTLGCWADQSGNGNDLNSSTSPTYQTGIINSQPVIRNTASTSIRDASFTQNDVSITLILAAQAASALQSDNFDSLMSMGAATGDSFQIDFSATSGGNYQFNKVSGGAVAYGTADTSPHILTLVIDGSNVNTFYDGGTGSSQSSTFTPDFTEFRLFANRGDNQFFVGDLAESILYLTALNSAERTLVENYLAAKYGIALSSGDKYA
ncbi:MAG: hypothetical protein ACE5GO_10530, partial [Anaerolineales bacterium]